MVRLEKGDNLAWKEKERIRVIKSEKQKEESEWKKRGNSVWKAKGKKSEKQKVETGGNWVWK